MENKKYYSPAFPSEIGSSGYRAGMTLRDYFAAKAMQGLISSFKGDVSAEFDIISIVSYKMADAMLNQREK